MENICNKSDQRQTQMNNLIQANVFPYQMETFGTLPDFFTFDELAAVPVAPILNSRTNARKNLGVNALPIQDNFVLNLELAATNLSCVNIESPQVRQRQHDAMFLYSPISDAGSPPPRQSLESLIVQEVLQLEEQQLMNSSSFDATSLPVQGNSVDVFLQNVPAPQRQITAMYSPISDISPPAENNLFVPQISPRSQEQQQITAMHSPISDATWPSAQESSTQQKIPLPANNTNLKRPRTTYKSSQVRRMEEYYQSRGYYVTKLEREKLAEELNLRPQQVKVWFQNRRAKQRRLDSMCPYQRYPQCYTGQYAFIQNVCCNDESCLSNYTQLPCCPQLPAMLPYCPQLQQEPRLPQVEPVDLELSSSSQKRNNDERDQVTLDTLDSDGDFGPPLQVPDFEVFN